MGRIFKRKKNHIHILSQCVLEPFRCTMLSKLYIFHSHFSGKCSDILIEFISYSLCYFCYFLLSSVQSVLISLFHPLTFHTFSICHHQPISASAAHILGDICRERYDVVLPMVRLLLHHNRFVPFVSAVATLELDNTQWVISHAYITDIVWPLAKLLLLIALFCFCVIFVVPAIIPTG